MARPPPKLDLRTAILVTVAFVLGSVAARWWLSPPAAPAPPEAPRLMIDGGGIELLPDASLRLDLPPAPSIDR